MMARLTTSSYIKITLIILLALFLFALAGLTRCSAIPSNFQSLSLSQTGDAQIDSQSVNNIEVNWAAGSVDISIHDGQDILLNEYSSTGVARAQQMRWDVTGNTLKIDYNRGLTCSSIDNKRLEIQIPQSLALRMGTITIDGDSGDYSVSGITSKSLKVNLASGNLEASNMQIGDLNLDVLSGNVLVGGEISGSVKVKVLSGKVEVAAQNIMPSALDADIASGTVIFSLPENEGFTVKVDKLSGDFESDFALQQTGKTYEYKNGGASIKADMASGHFILRRTA
jgi:DUF4097 and DUF4098 domain-containing protein YvlB